MAINSGTRLGVYEVRSAIGAGGMGEVYQARDTKLGRDVAIKVLPDAFTFDAERLSRFQREAKMLAALNHPNIASIYGLEEDSGRSYLVMELVPGETLQEKISKDGAVPIEEALNIARQIAEALESAHARGIIHRDLKPANIKLTPDGKVKVLDLGLAKAYEENQSSLDLNNSPTMSQAATMQGMILGTAAYMSPEQARGRNVDKRTDIWAFGVVLYELLTGERLFTGEDVTETLASVVKDRPDLTKVPAKVRRLLERCLEKDPKKRLRDIGDWELLLEAAPAAAPAEKAVTPAWMSARVAWGAATLFLVVAAALALVHFREKPPAPEAPVRFQLPAPENGSISFLAISPDGSNLALIVQGTDGQPVIWIHPMDGIQSRKLSGTDGVLQLAWSPDSRYLAFNGGGKLKKVDVAGGAPETICSYSPPFTGVAWSSQDAIVFGGGLVLNRVNASGGEVVPLTQLDPKREEVGHGGPVFLPDGQHFLYLVAGASERTGLYLGSIDAKPAQQDPQRLVDTTASAVFVPGADGKPGNVMYIRSETIMARPFDPKKREFTGPAAHVLDGVGVSEGYIALFTASNNGILAVSTLGSENRQLMWFDRTGKALAKAGETAPRDEMELSPDGTRVAEGRVDAQANWGVWILDLARGSSSRFTFEGNGAGNAIWSPDGSFIAYASGGGNSTDIFRRASNGATKAEVIFHSDNLKHPLDWSPDGRWLLYEERGKDTGADLWALPDASGPATEERKPIPYLVTPFSETQAKFSPDGKWVAYSSNESGAVEIYVRPFPASTGGKWLVSNGGGRQARWRRDGKELFYVAPNGDMMSVDVKSTAGTLEASTPKVLFHPPILGGQGGGPTAAWRYDVSRDGQRFLINAATEEKTSTPVTVTTHWTELLKK
jgi:serine/threonine protein kinase/Tol biopolymer transport system component